MKVVLETIFLVLFKTEEVHIWVWAIFSKQWDCDVSSDEKWKYVSMEIMQGIRKHMGRPWLPSRLHPVSTWADFSFPIRPLYRLTSVVPTIFQTSLYLSTFGSALPYWCQTWSCDLLWPSLDAKRSSLGLCHCPKNKPAGGVQEIPEGEPGYPAWRHSRPSSWLQTHDWVSSAKISQAQLR